MPSIKSELRSLVTPGGAMILDIEADEMLTLNITGGYVWERLREGKTIEQIIADLAKETGQDTAVVGNDVEEFVEQLEKKHLLSR